MIKGQRARTDRGSPLSDRPWRLGALVTGDFQCAWSACSMWCLAREAGTDRSFDEPKLDPHAAFDKRTAGVGPGSDGDGAHRLLEPN